MLVVSISECTGLQSLPAGVLRSLSAPRPSAREPTPASAKPCHGVPSEVAARPRASVRSRSARDCEGESPPGANVLAAGVNLLVGVMPSMHRLISSGGSGCEPPICPTAAAPHAHPKMSPSRTSSAWHQPYKKPAANASPAPVVSTTCRAIVGCSQRSSRETAIAPSLPRVTTISLHRFWSRIWKAASTESGSPCGWCVIRVSSSWLQMSTSTRWRRS
mmetsp:Transcript_984/g.3110  ORF Transcript_984/g.3110 Transcript_984/m.3110 type:complete len:218 (+) Transcript_984:535-1188(+)